MNKRKLNAIMQLHGESQQEIAAIQEHYSLSAEEVNEIFFATAVSLKDTAHPATPEKSA